MPTPMPSPLPTPSKQRLLQLRKNSTESSTQENTADETESEPSVTIERSSSDTSGADARVFFKSFSNKINKGNPSKMPLIVPKLVLNMSSPGTSPVASPSSSPRIKSKPPPLVLQDTYLNSPETGIPLVPIINVHDDRGKVLERFDSTPRQRSQSVDVGSVLKLPSITISPVQEQSSLKTNNQVEQYEMPLLTITCASPISKRKCRSNSIPEEIEEHIVSELNSKYESSSGKEIFKHELQSNKPEQLSLHQESIKNPVPTIALVDSDPDSPIVSLRSKSNGANFLTPYFGTAGLHASESNLSSSGYSSAYSPGPSRCNSNSPLFLGEQEEPLTPSVSSIPSRSQAFLTLSPDKGSHNTEPSNTYSINSADRDSNVSISSGKVESFLRRTDSETTDDPHTSQQDSALEIDTNDEPEHNLIEQPFHKIILAADSEPNIQPDIQLIVDSEDVTPRETSKLPTQPPTIVVHTSLQSESSVEDHLSEKPKLSPVSSRSESPISDSKLSVQKIHPAFFSKAGKLELPYTDSDGLYDFPSSEVLNSDSSRSRSTRYGRKKSRRSNMRNKERSTYTNQIQRTLESGNEKLTTVNYKESLELPSYRSPKRMSPKKRTRIHSNIDLLSSSNESITSHR